MLNLKSDNHYISQIRQKNTVEHLMIPYLFGLVSAILIAVCSYSVCACLLNGLFRWKGSKSMFMTVLFVSLLCYGTYVVREKWKRVGGYLSIVTYAIYTILCLATLSPIVKGLILMFNQIISLANNYYSCDISKIEVAYLEHADSGANEYILIATAFLAVFFVFIFSKLYYLRKSCLWFLVISVLTLLIPILVGKLPEEKFFIFYGISAIIYVGSKGGRADYSDNYVQAKTSLILTVVLLLLSGVVMLFCPPSKFNENKFFSSSKRALQDKMDVFFTREYWSETSILDPFQTISNEETKNGNLSRAGKIRFRNVNVLKVTLNELYKGNLYLKNYVGEDYQTTTWANFESSDYKKAKETLRLQSIYLEQYYATGFAVRNGDDASLLSSMKIERLRSNTKLTIPYFIKNYYELGEDGKISYLEVYDENNIYNFYQYFSENVQQNETILKYYGEDASIKSIETNSEYYLNHNKIVNFVNNYYLNLDQCPKVINDELVTKILKDYGKGNRSDIVTKINAVQDYLKDNFTYTLSPKKTGSDEDFVTHFMETKQGYCVHYATTATLLFRKMGIPARYVEGYLIKKNDIKKAYNEKNEDGSYDVYALDSDGHAWVEIYLNYLGWVPIEVTFSSDEDGSVTEATPTPKPDKTEDNITPTDTPKLTDTPENSDANKQSEGKKETSDWLKKVLQVVKVIIKVIVAILLIPSVIWLRRIVLMNYFLYQLSAKKTNERILFIYEKLEKVFSYLGVAYTNQDMKEHSIEAYDKIKHYTKQNCSHIEYMDREKFLHVFQIIYRASFDYREISDEEYKVVEDFYYMIRRFCQTTRVKKDKLIFQYFIVF